jgi:hypothetical protein
MSNIEPVADTVESMHVKAELLMDIIAKRDARIENLQAIARLAHGRIIEGGVPEEIAAILQRALL